jgi:hypothetical protein
MIFYGQPPKTGFTQFFASCRASRLRENRALPDFSPVAKIGSA